MSKIFFFIFTIGISSWSFAQSRQKMEATTAPKVYQTSPEQKKPLQSTFQHETKDEKVYIKRSTFKTYPRKKQKAILAENEKYVIVED